MSHRLLALPLAAVCVISLLAACNTRRPQPSEAALFATASDNSVWVFDAVTAWPDGKEQHTCALITQSQQDGQQFTGCYLRTWQTGGETHSGFSLGIGQLLGKSGKWPITMRMQVDSIQSPFSLDWGHRYFWMRGHLPSSTAELPTSPWSWKGRYPDQQAFPAVVVCEAPSVWSAAPWSGVSRMSGTRGKGSTRWRLGVFKEAASVFGAEAGAAFVWLSVGLADGRTTQAYLRVDAQGRAQLLGQRIWEGQVPKASNADRSSFLLAPASMWVSPRTGKAYPLLWQLDSDGRCCQAEGQIDRIALRPRTLDLENAMKRSSFWMGPIEAIEAGSSKVLGKGNMFVFVR
jgi:Lipocalin-like domain